ncbi:MAG TPA: metallopeptidase family protein [Micavibrio sp.]|nr:metallopeptidase family protein [Micavibrio sp.]
MSFSRPPGADDIETIAGEILSSLPEEIIEHCESLTIEVEEFPDEATQTEMELDDPYELVALYRSGKEISPGVERKIANDDDILVLYRRPILDLWCDTQDDLTALIREVMIEELAGNFDFSDDEIEEMTRRHHQGML